MKEIIKSADPEMTDEEYRLWLRDFQMTVDSRLAKGAKFLPSVPARVWRYWAIRSRNLDEMEDVNTNPAD